MESKSILQALIRKGYRAFWFETGAEAVDYLASQVQGVCVGFGDSATLGALGLAARLAQNNTVIDPSPYAGEEFNEAARRALDTEVFFTSVNGAAETGELVNIDSTGNRAAGSLFGHKKVFFVFGVNKIEPTLEKAVWRARNIAAPQNAKRFGFKTPCARKGDRCYDCSSPDRICNGLVIYLHKMKGVEAEVVIINESLGM